MLEVSRTPVREALARLHAEGPRAAAPRGRVRAGVPRHGPHRRALRGAQVARAHGGAPHGRRRRRRATTAVTHDRTALLDLRRDWVALEDDAARARRPRVRARRRGLPHPAGAVERQHRARRDAGHGQRAHPHRAGARLPHRGAHPARRSRSTSASSTACSTDGRRAPSSGSRRTSTSRPGSRPQRALTAMVRMLAGRTRSALDG